MRSDGAKAGNVAVTIRYLDFKNRSHQKKLDRTIDTTREVYDTARALLRELWKDKRALRLIGISLTGLARGEEHEQISLFEDPKDPNREKSAKKDKTVDALRSKYGADIIQRGSVLQSGIRVARKFKGKQDAEHAE